MAGIYSSLNPTVCLMHTKFIPRTLNFHRDMVSKDKIIFFPIVSAFVINKYRSKTGLLIMYMLILISSYQSLRYLTLISQMQEWFILFQESTFIFRVHLFWFYVYFIHIITFSLIYIFRLSIKTYFNKNDNIQKSEAQEIR